MLLAKPGVLWLNTCITVPVHKANSHAKKGWEFFTDASTFDAVLNRANDTGHEMVFFSRLGSCRKRRVSGCWLMRYVHFRAFVGKAGWFLARSCAWSDHQKKHFILKYVPPFIWFRLTRLIARSTHPSLLSVHLGFLGNGHPKRANERSRENDGDVIDWTALQGDLDDTCRSLVDNWIIPIIAACVHFEWHGM